jgi:hypothetical protein
VSDVTTPSRPFAVFTLLALIAACAGPSSPATATRPSPSTAISGATPSPSATAECPNPNGGDCLGELEAGTHRTVAFEPGLTYTVPTGWGNYEDLPGNVLLVPPGSTLEEGDAGTGEYIGIYDGIALPGGPPECVEAPRPGMEHTPEGIAAALASQEGLSATQSDVTIGGLEGIMLDLSVADGYTGTCPFASGMPVVPILIGTGPAGLHHVLTADFDMRLYLLEEPRGLTVAIEVIDAPERASLEELSAVVEQMSFEP